MSKLALLLTGGLIVASAIYVSKHDISISLQIQQMNRFYNRLKRRAKQLHITKNLRKGFKKQVKAFKSATQWLGALGNGNLVKAH